MRGRTAFLFVNLVILSLSILTALHVVPGPDVIGIFLAFYSLFVLPGMLLTGLLSVSHQMTLERVCTIFVTSLLFLSIMIWLGLVPGFSYRVIALVSALFQLVMMLLLYGRERRRKEDSSRSGAYSKKGVLRRNRFGTTVFIILIFAVCFVIFYGAGSTGSGTDSPDHISYIRRCLDSGSLFPHDSFYAGGDGVGFDPRKGLWHPIAALWTWQSDTSVETLWMAMPSFLGFFALAFFAWFVIVLTGRSYYAALAVPLLLLFYRGEGLGWFAEVGYSRNVAQILLWGGSAYLLRYLETGTARYLVLVFLAALIGTAIHISAAINFASILFAFFIYTALTPSGKRWRLRFWKLLPVAAVGTALPLAVRVLNTSRAFNLIHTHRQGMLVISERFAMIDPAELLLGTSAAFVFAFLMLPLFFVTAAERSRRTLIGILFAVPALTVINPITGVFLERTFGYLHYRILYAAPLFCYITILLSGLFRMLLHGRFELAKEGSPKSKHHGAITRRDAERRRNRTRAAGIAAAIWTRVLAAALIGLFIAVPVRLSFFGAVDAADRLIGQSELAMKGDYYRLSERLQHSLPRHSVIVSDPRTSYLVSAYSDHYVTVTLDQHGSPSDTLALDRLEAVRDLFSPAVALEESVAWLERNNVGYLILCENEGSTSDFFGTFPRGAAGDLYDKFKNSSGLLAEIDSIGSFRLFEVDRSALGKAGPAASPAGQAPAGVPCSGFHTVSEEPSIRGEGIILDTLVLDRDHYAPGDTLKGYFCWRLEHDLTFGRPIEWTLRMDMDFPRGPFYRDWYGKQYRRRIERKGQRFYRYTISGPIVSGFSMPDQWIAGKSYRQDFTIPLSGWLAAGSYEVHITINRPSYLENRRISDYLLNEDSFHGGLAGSLRIAKELSLENPGGL